MIIGVIMAAMGTVIGIIKKESAYCSWLIDFFILLDYYNSINEINDIMNGYY